MDEQVRALVEAAGGYFLYVLGDEAFFRDGRNGAQMSLYVSACRSVEDVALAIKANREKIRSDLNIWERAGEVETQV
jgi:hypothetical protein